MRLSAHDYAKAYVDAASAAGSREEARRAAETLAALLKSKREERLFGRVIEIAERLVAERDSVSVSIVSEEPVSAKLKDALIAGMGIDPGTARIEERSAAGIGPGVRVQVGTRWST
jgi:hypothetical protein